MASYESFLLQEVTAGVEKVIMLTSPASIVRVINATASAMYVKSSTVVLADSEAAAVIPANSSMDVNFDADMAAAVHVISASGGTVNIEVLSIFSPLHLVTLTANVETIIDLKERCQRYDVMNMSGAGVVYFALDCKATVMGPQTIKLAAGMAFGEIKSVQKIRLISTAAPEVQIVARR